MFIKTRGLTSVTIVFVLFTLLNAVAYGQSTGPDGEPIRIEKIINRIGWKLPSVKQLSLIRRSQRAMHGTLLTQYDYKPKAELDMSVSDYFRGKDGTLIVNTYNLIVRDVSTYEYHNRVFAFEIAYVPYTIGDDGVKRILGAVIRKYYFDEDGDGLFESLYDMPSMPNFVPRTGSNTK